jgi:hypothetical protein
LMPQRMQTRSRPTSVVKGRSPRVERFVAECLKDLNGARAARAAGYAPGSAKVTVAPAANQS